MTEDKAISALDHPNTVDTLVTDFSNLGITAGETLLVHSSLSALGWVCGGAVAVVQALMRVLTDQGTLVMPTHSGDLTDPCRWHVPPVPESWWQPIRDTMPAFHPAYTPSRGMGKIPEVFRTMPGVLRSNHPILSFAAWGRQAEFITANHRLEHSLGDGSPLARVYDLDGRVLLLGVGFGNNTSFHLSEDRAGTSKTQREGSPITVNGQRIWQEYEDVDWNEDPFVQIGADYEAGGAVITGKVGAGEARLFRQRPAVDFAVDWLKNHPKKEA